MQAPRLLTGLLILLAGLWIFSTLDAPDAQAQSRARAVLEIVDSDDIVAPGDDVTVHVFVRSPDTTKTYELHFFHAVGGPAKINDGAKLMPEPEHPDENYTYHYVSTVELVVPLGSQHREATLSAVVQEVDGTDRESLDLAVTKLTIGDAGDDLGDAEISSTYEDCEDSGPRSSTSLRTREKAYLKLEVLNSLGNPANDSDVNSAFITAAGAKITICGENTSVDHHMKINDADAEIAFFLESIDRKPIHINVHAFAIGDDGSVRSNTLVVNFAGAADSLKVGEPAGTLAARHGKLRIPVAGLDSAGNRDNLTTAVVQAELTDGPEEADLSLLTIGKSLCSRSERDCEEGDVVLLVSSPTAEDEEAAQGEYTLEVQLTTDPDETVHEVTIHVVGEPVSMTLELLDGANPAVREVFTAKGRAGYEYGSGESGQLIVGPTQTIYAAVTLSDEDGQLISNTSRSVSDDGIRFQVVGALNVNLLTTQEQEIVDGVAYIRFLVTGEEGRSLVLATSRDLQAHVAIVAQEQARFGLDGLTHRDPNHFSAWIAANDVPVADLYPLLQSRGIKAVWLWQANDKGWLLYAQVNGAPIPGATNYRITYGDTLWFSK